jgi:hypothetical protein
MVSSIGTKTKAPITAIAGESIAAAQRRSDERALERWQ